MSKKNSSSFATIFNKTASNKHENKKLTIGTKDCNCTGIMIWVVCDINQYSTASSTYTVITRCFYRLASINLVCSYSRPLSKQSWIYIAIRLLQLAWFWLHEMEFYKSCVLSLVKSLVFKLAAQNQDLGQLSAVDLMISTVFNC